MDGELKFEGEYINGERNGKGKQYYENGNLKFEGEFINDEIIADTKYDKNGNIIYELINGNGKVKEYDDIYGKLIFEGEYLNCKRNGKGKEYDDYGNIIYEGEYLNGERKNK